MPPLDVIKVVPYPISSYMDLDHPLKVFLIDMNPWALFPGFPKGIYYVGKLDAGRVDLEINRSQYSPNALSIMLQSWLIVSLNSLQFKHISCS